MSTFRRPGEPIGGRRERRPRYEMMVVACLRVEEMVRRAWVRCISKVVPMGPADGLDIRAE